MFAIYRANQHNNGVGGHFKRVEIGEMNTTKTTPSFGESIHTNLTIKTIGRV